MTGDTIECFNCGHVNPGWAQVCRSCGVPLRHAAARTTPIGPIPTDRDSLISIGAVVATILLAVIVGFFVSSLYSSTPSIGFGPDETPSVSAQPSLLPSSSALPATPTPVPTPSPTPPLPGAVTFGTGLDGNQNVTGTPEGNTFRPGMVFAHSITMTEPFGVPVIGEQVVRINDDGTEDVVVDHAGNELGVDPADVRAGFIAGLADGFVRDWRPGLFELRVYRDGVLSASGQFRLADG